MRVLSLGAGVQSSTLLLMACHGELELDAAIFADTQWEPAGVYEWLGVLEGHAAKAGIRFERITRGSLRADSLSHEGGHYARMPLYQTNADGSPGIARRQCTQEYKIAPIQKRLRALGATSKHPIDLAIGISLDEVHRMRDARVLYVHHVFPLIERRMTRSGCLDWLARHGYPEPMKSACVGCPFRRNAGWKSLTPLEMADAVDFDQRIRHDPKGRWQGERFLHDSRVPLSEADLDRAVATRQPYRTEQERGQLDMFEPDGCGVLCPADDEA